MWACFPQYVVSMVKPRSIMECVISQDKILAMSVMQGDFLPDHWGVIKRVPIQLKRNAKNRKRDQKASFSNLPAELADLYFGKR